MNILKNNKNIIVLCDFDGTITTEDTNVKLFNKIGDKDIIQKYREKYYNGEIDIRTLSNNQFDSVKLSKESYLDFILNEIKLQRGFKLFYTNLNKYKIPFVIVSGGYETGIRPFLNKHGFNDIPIYANKLIFNGDSVTAQYYDEEHFPDLIRKDCYKDFKVEIVKKYRKKYDRIIFIGDGSTDINIADKVDYLFAKDYLRDYCIKNNIDHIDWEDFNDVNKWIFRY
ncbi:MtnX-like HAD-IB family phosphatase [Schnuerera ultunensis]|uniref:Putative 2,3-diketo-5-methylthio-1-phosphopentane phosphatase n=1 Tax=[Clostridium] ultunense Esp TaxID=1288971 RepID=A0A1M4PLV7_9FIRM|nr:MtnX-like HAD-IB family phosphatase [Schnuerera ultunensis]SHD76442.1 putative 2,3-diketo-5-methylthio-1-phosphopentane phosphatase [[Clostridium] ultunense Esp]